MRRNKSNIVLISRIHKNNLAAKAFFLCFVSLFLVTTCFAQHAFSIQFRNYAGSELLQTQHAYVNAAGEQFTVRNFRYYISHIVLKNALQQELHEAYFLVDEADSASKHILLQTNLIT